MNLYGLKLEMVRYIKKGEVYRFSARIMYGGKSAIDVDLKIQEGKIIEAKRENIGTFDSVKYVNGIADKLYKNITKEVEIEGYTVGEYTASLDLLVMYLYDMYQYNELAKGVGRNNVQFYIYKLNEGKGKNYDPFDNRSIAEIKPLEETKMYVKEFKETEVTEKEAEQIVSNQEGLKAPYAVVSSILARGTLPEEITIEQYYSIYQ